MIISVGPGENNSTWFMFEKFVGADAPPVNRGKATMVISSGASRLLVCRRLRLLRLVVADATPVSSGLTPFAVSRRLRLLRLVGADAPPVSRGLSPSPVNGCFAPLVVGFGAARLLVTGDPEGVKPTNNCSVSSSGHRHLPHHASHENQQPTTSPSINQAIGIFPITHPTRTNN